MPRDIRGAAPDHAKDEQYADRQQHLAGQLWPRTLAHERACTVKS